MRRKGREKPFQERDLGMCGGGRGVVEGLEWFPLFGENGMTQEIFLQTQSMHHTIMGEEGTLNTLALIHKNFF